MYKRLSNNDNEPYGDWRDFYNDADNLTGNPFDTVYTASFRNLLSSPGSYDLIHNELDKTDIPNTYISLGAGMYSFYGAHLKLLSEAKQTDTQPKIILVDYGFKEERLQNVHTGRVTGFDNLFNTNSTLLTIEADVVEFLKNQIDELLDTDDTVWLEISNILNYLVWDDLAEPLAKLLSRTEIVLINEHDASTMVIEDGFQSLRHKINLEDVRSFFNENNFQKLIGISDDKALQLMEDTRDKKELIMKVKNPALKTFTEILVHKKEQ